MIVSASGSHVTKAVTVVELLKRRVPVSDSATKGDWSISACTGIPWPVSVGLTNQNTECLHH